MKLIDCCLWATHDGNLGDGSQCDENLQRTSLFPTTQNLKKLIPPNYLLLRNHLAFMFWHQIPSKNIFHSPKCSWWYVATDVVYKVILNNQSNQLTSPYHHAHYSWAPHSMGLSWIDIICKGPKLFSCFHPHSFWPMKAAFLICNHSYEYIQ